MKIFETAARRSLVALAAFILAIACEVTASAQNLPPTWVFARDYAGWNIQGQQANTFTFNGGACNYTPKTNGNEPSFFVFGGTLGATAVYYPVAIVDANTTNSEIVTPTSTTQSAGACGFAAAVQNQHISFNLISGTAGLQEAIVTQQQSTPVFNVILDKYWYQSVAALPTYPVTPTPQLIISSVTGNSNIGFVDITTEPWTTYSWNGAKYVANAPTGSLQFTSLTAVSAPALISNASTTYSILTTATTGGTIPASSTYRLCATYVTALGGETGCSADTTSASTIATGGSIATNTITVTSPAAATGAVGWRLYMTAASGTTLTEILYTPTGLCATPATGQTSLNGVCAIGSSATITAIVTGKAKVPAVSSAFLPTSASTSPLQNVLTSYPPFANTGAVTTGTATTIGVVNLPAGYLNTLGRTIRICGAGVVNTTSAGGTLTLSTNLASVPGVTSITPFTVISPTIAGSALAVNFTFCQTWTTAATGTAGSIEAHGNVDYTVAATAVSSPAQDNAVAVVGTLDLTAQDQIEIVVTGASSEAISSSGAQLRQLTVEVLQ